MVSVVQISSIHQNTAVILHYQTQPSRWGMWLIYCSGNLWSCPMEFIAIPVIQKETMWHTTWNELGQGSLVSPPNIFASLNVNLMRVRLRLQCKQMGESQHLGSVGRSVGRFGSVRLSCEMRKQGMHLHVQHDHGYISMHMNLFPFFPDVIS